MLHLIEIEKFKIIIANRSFFFSNKQIIYYKLIFLILFLLYIEYLLKSNLSPICLKSFNEMKYLAHNCKWNTKFA